MGFDSGIRLAQLGDAKEIAIFYEEVRRDTVPIVHSVEEVETWIKSHLIPRGSSFVFVQERRVVAWLDVHDGWLDQLYCRQGFTCRRIGPALLNHAKALSGGELMLYTFQVNDGAQRFYAREGFKEVERSDGSSNEEGTPDVKMLWRREPA